MAYKREDFKKAEWEHKWVSVEMDPPFHASINVAQKGKSVFAPQAFDRVLGKVIDVREGLLHLKVKTLRIKKKNKEIGKDDAMLEMAYVPIPSIVNITVDEALCRQDPPPPPPPPEEEKPKAAAPAAKKPVPPAAKPAEGAETSKPEAAAKTADAAEVAAAAKPAAAPVEEKKEEAKAESPAAEETKAVPEAKPEEKPAES